MATAIASSILALALEEGAAKVSGASTLVTEKLSRRNVLGVQWEIQTEGGLRLESLGG